MSGMRGVQDVPRNEASKAHWDSMYERLTPAGVSWYEPQAARSLSLVDSLSLPSGTPVIDVGGGASRFVDGLIERGFSDVTVLDVSSAALDAARQRVGTNSNVRWVSQDLLRWQPDRRYGLWHDRAVFHFLTDPQDRLAYLNVLTEAVGRPGHVIIGTFAADGPQHCSGLPVMRYGEDELSAVLGRDFKVLQACRQEHVTPGGRVQPFTWVVAARTGLTSTT